MFSPAARPDDYWLDCVVEIAGPVLDDWHELFAGTWRRSAHRKLDVVMHPAADLWPSVELFDPTGISLGVAGAAAADRQYPQGCPARRRHDRLRL